MWNCHIISNTNYTANASHKRIYNHKNATRDLAKCSETVPRRQSAAETKFVAVGCTVRMKRENHRHGKQNQKRHSIYRKTSNTSRTLVGNKIVDNSDVVGTFKLWDLVRLILEVSR